MLHLDARVHFNEVVFAVLIHQKFDGTGIDIAHFARDFQRILIQVVARFLRHGKCRRVFHDLLIAALHRAVALIQMHDVSMRIAQNLHLDVLGLFDVFFKENIPVAKGLERLALHQREIIAQLLLVLDLAHAAPAAAGRRL